MTRTRSRLTSTKNAHFSLSIPAIASGCVIFHRVLSPFRNWCNQPLTPARRLTLFDRTLDRRTVTAMELTVLCVNARNVAAAPISMTKIQGCRDSCLTHTVALIAIRSHALPCKGIASGVTLNAGAIAKILVDVHRLFEVRRFSAIGASGQSRQ
jgi:hypothetical protein